jgi:hypothetical protein
MPVNIIHDSSQKLLVTQYGGFVHGSILCEFMEMQVS